MAQVNLTVNGRVYRMACEDGQEDHVSELGNRFNGAIDELRNALGEIGDQRLMVMAGILMTDRLDDIERKLGRTEQEVRELKERRLDANTRFETIEERFAQNIEQAAIRIERLAARLQGGSGQADSSGS